jgi:HD superfamily phosphodiesterase
MIHSKPELLDFYHFKNEFMKSAIKKCFSGERWVKLFLIDSHHGFKHANQVRLACLKIINNLDKKERKLFLKECKSINEKNSFECGVAVVEIASIFHDCGRFDSRGNIVLEEQKTHNRRGAKRAMEFCEKLGFIHAISYVEDAITSHDFQNYSLTPDGKPPKTLIGKIVQSSDQLGWFHPNSIHRTLKFAKVMQWPFYNSKASFEARLNWKPQTKALDGLTVMLAQLFGPSGPSRFGITYARKKVGSYKEELKRNILKLASKYKVRSQVANIISEYEKHYS